MLVKLKQIPLKVTLSALFLLSIFVLIVWLIPPLAITLVVGIGTAYSIVTLLTYWDSQR